MKRFKLSIAYVAILALIFTSCSKENDSDINSEGEKVNLTFGAIVNDLVENKAATKNRLSDVPECSESTPAYVEVVVSHNGSNVAGTMDDPLRINLVAGQIYTEEVAELKLTPDLYTLEYFTVHDASGEVIWVSPKSGSSMAGYVEHSLPMDINLGAGVKKYVDVPVLCYDNRDVNEYGYLFFDLDTNRAINFCVFGNFCDEDGRHYPANFRLDVWSYSGNPDAPKGSPLFNEADPYINMVGTMNNGDNYAEPLCVTLPDGDGEDWYYAEISLIDFNSGELEGELIRSGVFSDADVMELYNSDGETSEYYHFREGNCSMEDSSDMLNRDGINRGDLEPKGPAPEWGPTITDPMLVVIEQFLSYDVPPLHTLTAEEARQQPSIFDAYKDVIEKYDLQVPERNLNISSASIPVEGGQIEARIYTPNTGKDSYPVIVYYHGGGWVIAGIDAYENSIKALADKTEAIVVAVAYRQAPEYKFPTAHNDAYAAYLWTLENAESFNGDSGRVALAGESAGGNLATAVSLRARDNNVPLPVHQALVYPIANNDYNTPSYIEYRNAVPLNRPLMQWFFDKYLNSPAEGEHPWISLVDADLSGLPSTTIIGAQIDPLQSEGQQLAGELNAAGVETTYELFIGVTHEFFGMEAVLPKAEEAQNIVVANLREAFNH